MGSSSSKTLKGGLVLSFKEGTRKTARPKVLIVRQIMALRSAQIAKKFDVVGKHWIEAIREELITTLVDCTQPISHWEEVADLMKGNKEIEMSM